MGQYLAIGLSTQIAVKKQPLEKYSVTSTDVIQQMKADYHFQPDIFELSEDQDSWRWHLKDEIINSQLLPFLHALYPIIYRSDAKSYQDVLDALEREPSERWLQVAEQRSFEAFQEDPYGMTDCLYFDNKDFHPRSRVVYRSILLSMEGKVLMETYGRQFSFFQYCIHEAFSRFPIAQAIRVYITG